MKKNLLFGIAALSLMTILPGCAAFHTGTMSGSAALNSGNFSYVSHDLTGTSTATYIFGIGGMGKQSLVDVAKRDMLRTPLKNNQALANVNVSFKNTVILGVYSEKKCIVTADIVEFK